MDRTKQMWQFCGAGRIGAALALVLTLSGSEAALPAGALEDYVKQPDESYNWKKLEQRKIEGFTITRLELISQEWRGSNWSHDLQVVQPDTLRNPGIAFLLISGDGSGSRQLGLLQTLAERAGATAALVTRIPNQPRYQGRKEDALIAYTFAQFMQSGDESWPLLLPMTKSAVRAMDAIQAFAANENHQAIKSFVVSGASKRGWTTWLTGAVDPRVKAIAPMVIDILNMKAQLDWMKKVYGRQSEMIHDYTDLKLQDRMDEPRMVTLRSWVDPYSYRQRYTMPKLLLLGSNDPYWTVDSLRHYWNELPDPKLLFQTANAGHDLAGGKESVPALAVFFQMIADRQRLPIVEWQMGDLTNGAARVSVQVDQPVKRIRLWTAYSPDRDFRKARWTNSELKLTSGSRQATGTVPTPAQGYRAYMAEVVLVSPSGQEYKLSTEARVTPDDIK